MSRNFELLQQLENRSLMGAAMPAIATAESHVQPRRRAWQPGTPADEYLTGLAQRLFAGPQSPRTVVFTAVDDERGAEQICVRLAEIVAGEMESNICLVDAHLRRPALHEQFGLPASPGFADILDGSAPAAECARRIGGGNLSVLPAGTASPVISLDAASAALAQLRDRFARVVLYAPALALYEDAAVLGYLSDGVVLVLQADATRKEAALRVKEALSRRNVVLLGAVLNNRTYPVPERIYRWL